MSRFPRVRTARPAPLPLSAPQPGPRPGTRRASTTGRRTGVPRAVPAAAGALLLLPLAAGGCAAAFGESESLIGADSLVVGVKADQPGLGLVDNEGEFEGFDVDVARAIAEHLGVAGEDVEFVGVTSEEREEAILSGEVDLVLASYSITEERKTEIGFAGPYYVAHQDILVPGDDTGVQGVDDLDGQRICQGAGSNSANRIVEERGVDAEAVEGDSYSDCIDQLSDGDVDAVSTDDLILAGYLAAAPDEFRLVNEPFTNEKYGIGMAKEDVAGCEEVNRAVTLMYQDGTAEKLLDNWFGDTSLDLVTSVPQFEGCG